MNLLTWLAIGTGIFFLYAAYKGLSPFALLGSHLGFSTRSTTIGNKK